MTQKEFNEKITELVKELEISQGLRINFVNINHNIVYRYDEIEQDTLKIETNFYDKQPIDGLPIPEKAFNENCPEPQSI